MKRFFAKIISFSLLQRYFVLFITLVLAVVGVGAFLRTPIEAFPDVTNTQIIVVSQWSGRSAEEVERFVTIPIEVTMNAVQRKTNIRSVSMFGLSVIKIIFEDDVEDFFARQQVNNLLATVNLPAGAESDIQPPYGPTGEIFRYTLQSPNKNSRELAEIQNWVIDRRLRSVPGVADVVTFGGETKIYEVTLDPQLMAQYNLTPVDVFQALARSNQNVGGDVIEKNGQAYVVRGIGLLNDVREIENVIVDNRDGVPLLIRNVAHVHIGAAPRVGQVGLNKSDDVVEGIVVMRKGENPAEVLGRVKAKVAELNESLLPPDVKMVTFYDRDVLIGFCTKTVLRNLAEGILLVTAIVFLFMADWRTTVCVSIVIPLALLFAFICLRLKGMSANLLSLGAVDFGIIIDGAVVMVEGIFVALDHRAKKLGMEAFNKAAKWGLIKKTGGELAKAIFFSKLIIITALVPIFSFEKVEGKMFSPLAYTLGFALLGALLFTLTLVPLLAAILLRKNVREKHNLVVIWVERGVMAAFDFCRRFKYIALSVSFGILAFSFWSFQHLGSEFLPQLNEGALWVEAKLPMSQSLSETVKMVSRIRAELNSFEEVNGVLSQTGRSNDGTDPSGFYYAQLQVNLKPKDEWKRNISTDDLIEEMDARLKKYQGIGYNYSQPIIDNVAEAVAGINASLCAKIIGPNLQTLDSLADGVADNIKTIRGIKDLGIIRNIGQPELRVELDAERMAAYGVRTEDALSVVEMAFGGKAATELYEGERKFDIRVRYPAEYRRDESDVAALRVPTVNGSRIPLAEIGTVKPKTGGAFIYRDNHARFIGVKFSIRERDLGSTIAEAQTRVNANIKLPTGYKVEWSGEFENQVRANKRLAQMVPVSLVAIFIILFIMFGNPRDAALVLVNVPFALIGGIFALHLTGTVFSISAGIGFIALFGICVQNGVILISVFHKKLAEGESLADALRDGVAERVRPVVMTALMAAIGLLPAALSTGIGSETQKPLAIVVIGGLISATFLTLLVFPIIVELTFKTRIIKKAKEIPVS